MVVRGEVPAAGVDDEAVGTELAPRPGAVERAVAALHAEPSADGLGEEEHGVARDRSAGPRGGGEPERRLERLDPASERVREHAMELLESAVDRRRFAREALPPSRDEPEHDDDRLVAGEHERRQPVAGPHAVAAADASLTLDGDSQILEGRDVAPHGARVDLEVGGDLPPRDERTRLEELEQLEEPGGRCLHPGESLTDRGRDTPYLCRTLVSGTTTGGDR